MHDALHEARSTCDMTRPAAQVSGVWSVRHSTDLTHRRTRHAARATTHSHVRNARAHRFETPKLPSQPPATTVVQCDHCTKHVAQASARRRASRCCSCSSAADDRAVRDASGSASLRALEQPSAAKCLLADGWARSQCRPSARARTCRRTRTAPAARAHSSASARAGPRPPPSRNQRSAAASG